MGRNKLNKKAQRKKEREQIVARFEYKQDKEMERLGTTSNCEECSYFRAFQNSPPSFLTVLWCELLDIKLGLREGGGSYDGPLEAPPECPKRKKGT